MGINLMDDGGFTISYVLYITPKYPPGHQLTYQENKNVWMVSIYGEKRITGKVSLEYIE